MSTLPTHPNQMPTQESPRAPAGHGGAKVLRFKRATKEASKLRLALIGGSKSGKTYTALAIAQGLVPGGRVAVLDTEHGSASKYAGPTATPHGFEFDSLEIDSFHPRAYIDAIKAAEAEGYDVLVIDSLSHEWMGPDGALELVDRAARKSANSFVAWGDVTPLHREMIETLLKSKLHVIATMRAKTEYVLEADKKGKMVPRKIGLAPVQRDGIEYEFDVACELTQDHELSVMTSSRCEGMNERTFRKAGADVAAILRAWLAADGATPAAKTAAPIAAAAPPLCPPPAPVDGPMTDDERAAKTALDPALKNATTDEEVEILRKEAVLAAAIDPRDPSKRKPSPAYWAWYQAAIRAAQLRVGGGS